MEIWLPIASTNGDYEASSLGNIRSTYRVIQKSKNPQAKTYTRKSKVLKPALAGGYYKVAFSTLSKKFTSYLVSRLVCEAFHSNTENKPEVNHINGNKLDNRPENLEWVTKSENCKHSFDTGLQQPKIGSLNGNSKLTESDVIAIREAASCGKRYYGRKQLAAKYGISEAHIKDIVNRRRSVWYHV